MPVLRQLLSGISPNPVERTYLTTGILEAIMRSHGTAGQRIDTPHLNIAYKPTQPPARRPKSERPIGACLDPWPLPEPGATPAATSIPIDYDGTIRGRR